MQIVPFVFLVFSVVKTLHCLFVLQKRLNLNFGCNRACAAMWSDAEAQTGTRSGQTGCCACVPRLFLACRGWAVSAGPNVSPLRLPCLLHALAFLLAVTCLLIYGFLIFNNALNTGEATKKELLYIKTSASGFTRGKGDQTCAQPSPVLKFPSLLFIWQQYLNALASCKYPVRGDSLSQEPKQIRQAEEGAQRDGETCPSHLARRPAGPGIGTGLLGSCHCHCRFGIHPDGSVPASACPGPGIGGLCPPPSNRKYFGVLPFGLLLKQ